VYLTLASFGFLVVTMIGVFSSDHGRTRVPAVIEDAASVRLQLPGVTFIFEVAS